MRRRRAAPAAVAVDNDLPACQPGIALRATDTNRPVGFTRTSLSFTSNPASYDRPHDLEPNAARSRRWRCCRCCAGRRACRCRPASTLRTRADLGLCRRGAATAPLCEAVASRSASRCASVGGGISDIRSSRSRTSCLIAAPVSTPMVSVDWRDGGQDGAGLRVEEVRVSVPSGVIVATMSGMCT